MAAGRNHDFIRAVAAFIFAIDNRHRTSTINACAAFKPGDFVFLEQKINAGCQARHDIVFGLHHRRQIQFYRANRHTHASQMTRRCIGIMFRRIQQGF